MTEKNTIVNEKDEIIGYKERELITEKDIYRVSALWITNSKGEILLAQRAFTKKNDPGKWGPAVAGTVEEKESYEDNIIKEAEEEIGLTGIKFEKWIKLRSEGKHQFFAQWFKTVVDKPISYFKIQTDEVANIKWFKEKELNDEITKKPELFLNSVKRIIKKDY